MQPNEAAIVVLVSRKLPRKSLTKASLLPSHLDGIPIDVVEVGAIEALDAGRARRKRMRRG